MSDGDLGRHTITPNVLWTSSLLPQIYMLIMLTYSLGYSFGQLSWLCPPLYVNFSHVKYCLQSKGNVTGVEGIKMVAILRKGLYPQKKILDSPFLILNQLLSLKLPLINFVIFCKIVKWYLDFQTSNCSDINGEVDFKFVHGEWRTTCSFLIYELYLLLPILRRLNLNCL